MSVVYLVGAGPGDVELLTLKAKDLIARADVIVYDRLADDKILQFASDTAERIYVGKAPGHHSMKQEEISQLLVDLTKKYNFIVRLKGGDPFVFGRGGEEALLLAENNVSFEIVPGVTSAIAVPAYAGIPVTHRGIATSFAVITGHEMSDKSNIRWDKLSTGVDTLVFLMGVENLPKIAQNLIDNGKPANTPTAIIQNGTKPAQRVLITTIENAAEDVKREGITSPAIILVGGVVELREHIKWFDNKPLFGKKILVTRARAQASKLTKKLSELGANCVEMPTIKIINPSDNFAAIDSSIDRIYEYDFIIFTSVNGVNNFFDRLQLKNLDTRALAKAKIAAIGSATANELLNHGIKADFVPKEFKAEAIVELLKNNVNGKKILIPRAEEAREILPQELIKYGAEVDVAPTYKTISAVEDDINLDNIELITFTSSSTVKNLLSSINKDNLKNIKTAAIGPITSATLKDFGIDADIVATEYTIDGLVEAIRSFYMR